MSDSDDEAEADAASPAEGEGRRQRRWASRSRSSPPLPSLTPRSAEGRRMPSYYASSAVRSFEDGEQANDAGHFCPMVVPLNVGGVCFITRRSTLLKFPNSMLAAMFSGRHEMQKDKHGYYFIDTNGVYFGYVLDFLRHGTLPPNEVALQVHDEAQYFGLSELQAALSLTPSVARHRVQRLHELQFGDYAGMRRRVIDAAVELGVATRVAELCVWPHRSQASAQHSSCVAETAHVKLGPWDGAADEDTLMRTLHADLADSGFQLLPLEKKRCKFFVAGQTCARIAYRLCFKFT